MDTPQEREAEQIRQSLERLTPKGFKVYEHENTGWFVDDGYESRGPFDDAHEALQAAKDMDEYSGPPESPDGPWGGGFASNH